MKIRENEQKDKQMILRSIGTYRIKKLGKKKNNIIKKWPIIEKI